MRQGKDDGTGQSRPGGRRRVYEIVDWPQMEPDRRYRRGEPSPLLYVRCWINSRAAVGIHRGDIDRKRRAMTAGGNSNLYGIYRLLCEFAGDRCDLRGLLVDHRGHPLTLAAISEWIGESIKDTQAALRLLCSSRIGVLRKVDYDTAIARVRAREALDRAETPVHADATAGVGEEFHVPAPRTTARHEDRETADGGPAGPSMTRPPPGGGEGSGRVASGSNSNPNSNRNSSAGAELNGQAAPDQLTTDTEQNRNNGHGQGNGYGDGGAERNDKAEAEPPATDTGQQGTDPAAGGQGQAGSSRSAGGQGPAGQPAGNDEQGTDPAAGGQGLRRRRSAEGIAGVTTIPAILNDETGQAFAADIYTRLHLPVDWPTRRRRRNLGAFAATWRRACEETRGLLGLSAIEPLPGWLIDWGMKRQREAIRLAKLRDKGADDRARMWQGAAGKTWQVLCDAMIPETTAGETPENGQDGGHK